MCEWRDRICWIVGTATADRVDTLAAAAARHLRVRGSARSACVSALWQGLIDGDWCWSL